MERSLDSRVARISRTDALADGGAAEKLHRFGCMMPAADLVECSNCHSFFAAASGEDVFFHATCGCRYAADRLEQSAVPGDATGFDHRVPA